MKRPWQIWLLYAIGLAILVPAFAWLTVQALELDRAESMARRQVEQEGRISVALWRMDFLLAPLLADEAARPDFVYRAVYPADAAADPVEPSKGKPTAEPQLELSPLLADPPPFVLLHFEVHSDGSVTSPQCPTGKDNAWAADNGISPARLAAAARRLDELGPELKFANLLAQLPAASLTPALVGAPQGGGEFHAEANPPVISNTLEGYEQYALDQTDAQQAAQPVGNSRSALSQPNQAASNTPPGAYQNAGVAAEFAQQTSGQQAINQQQSGQPESGQQLAYGLNGGGRGQRVPSAYSYNNDLPNRGAQLQNLAQQRYVEQRGNLRQTNPRPASPQPRAVEGPTRQLWYAGRLILARRVQVGNETVVQGCWLDWEQLKRRLTAEVADLLPQVELSPWALADPGLPDERVHLLAGLPVQLTVPPVAPPAAGWTPIRVSLMVSWICLAITALAGAAMLNSVLVLSERRGAFVSAVTHELRTPLTTFRMYAEMLAENMVPDAGQRQRYLQTLKTEADRLAHLVENVLQYARLERGRPGHRREAVTLDALLHRCQSRLADRAAQAEMKLEVEIQDADRVAMLSTDSAAVEQILFNLVDNACKYAAAAADKRIHLLLTAEPRQVRIAVRDHGPGISAAGRRKLFRPFSKSVHEAASTAPGVGLGLALSKRLAADLGGCLELQTPANGGAAFVLTLPRG